MAKESWSDVDSTLLGNLLNECSSMNEIEPQSFVITPGEDDLQDIIRELVDVVANWKGIGTFLGIRDGQLQAIKLQGNSPLDCLREMLVTWLRRNYNVGRFGEPTWVKVVEAVNDPTGGGNPSLAMEIAGRHKGIYKMMYDGV